ncbi:Sugar (and other) transporter [Ceratobasidium sp. AG-Ba]|nr:Sugar (and other) transporter [Ceratobasidium sp. AG-Ba]
MTMGLGMPAMPFSPRWLFQNGRVEEAWKVLDAFDRHSSAEKEKEELMARAAERQGRTLLAIFMMGMQQLSGIDGVLFYGPILFSQAGLGSRQASFLASGVSGLLNIASTIPAQLYLLDHWGRRPSAVVGGWVMTVCMLAIGSLYAAGAQNGEGRWAIIVLIYVSVFLFSTTWAVSFKIFITEIQPMRARATVSSLAHSSNWLANLAVALTTPLFLSRSPYGPYFMFGGCLLLTSVVCFIWMPETLGKSLQEVEEVWEARMKHNRQLFESLMTLGVGRRRHRQPSVEEVELEGRKTDA